MRVAGSDLLLSGEIGDGKGRDLAPVARAILHRRRGVGALRLVSLARSATELWLEVYDREGSREAALFDAAICAARWLLDSGRAGGENLRLRTRRGEMQVDILDGSSLGISVGPLLGLPGRGVLDASAALERRVLIEARGERFDALPVALAAAGGLRAENISAGEMRRGEVPEGGAATVAENNDGPAAAVFFHEGGEAPLRVRLSGTRRGGIPAVAVPARCLSEDELRIGTARDASVDAVAMAAMALGAANLLGLASNEAFVRSGDGGLWVRHSAEGRLYVAARPTYVFRGDFHLDDEGDES